MSYKFTVNDFSNAIAQVWADRLTDAMNPTLQAAIWRQRSWLIHSLEARGCERWLVDMVVAGWAYVPMPAGYRYPGEPDEVQPC